MSTTSHRRNLHLKRAARPAVVTLAGIACAALLLSGCGPAADRTTPPAAGGSVPGGPADAPEAIEPPGALQPAVTAATAEPVADPAPPAAPPTPAAPAVAPADTGAGLDDIDRALAELDRQLTDADHDVATPEGDIR